MNLQELEIQSHTECLLLFSYNEEFFANAIKAP
jgi:hypothetical protein